MMKTGHRLSAEKLGRLLKRNPLELFALDQLLRNDSLEMYCILTHAGGADGVCQLTQRELMSRLSRIITRATFNKNEFWLERLKLIECRKNPGDPLGTIYKVFPLITLPIPSALIAEFHLRLKHFFESRTAESSSGTDAVAITAAPEHRLPLSPRPDELALPKKTVTDGEPPFDFAAFADQRKTPVECYLGERTRARLDELHFDLQKSLPGAQKGRLTKSLLIEITLQIALGQLHPADFEYLADRLTAEDYDENNNYDGDSE